FIYMIKLPPKNLEYLTQRPQMYIKEYFIKYLKEFPTFLELYPQYSEVNHEIANLYIEEITDASGDDLKKFYYYLTMLILGSANNLNDSEYDILIEYLALAGDYLDAQSLRRRLMEHRYRRR